MSEEKNGQRETTIDALADILSEKVHAKQKPDPIPDIYKSGMRGAEKPPQLREQEKAKAKAKAADGKRTVTFTANAKPTVKGLQAENAALKKRLDDIEKKLGGKKTEKKKIKVKIA